MSFKVKMRVQRLVSFALTAFFLASVPCAEAAAAETNAVAVEELEVLEATGQKVSESMNAPNARTAFRGDVYTTFSSDGMYLEISTEASKVASVIGVKDIRIQKKVWYGWKTVAVCSGTEMEDVLKMKCILLYSNAEKGESYRVVSVYYADVDGYEEVECTTGDFVFTY